jgi:DNA-directed RNA polymerase subunit K/omega
MTTLTKKNELSLKEVESDIEESDVEESDVDESEEETVKAVVAEEEEEEEEASEAEASEEEASEAEEAEEEAEEEEGEEEEGEEAEEEGETKKIKKSGKKTVNSIGIEMLKTTKKTAAQNYDDDEEDEEEDVNYLQKFDSSLRENFILDHHPEARMHNYEEVKALTRVSRDGRGIIIDPLHKTIPFLTKYEMTRVIGQRAKQLDSGARAFVKVPINVIDGYQIALLELEQKKMPFIIKRPYPNGGVEYWNVSDLELLQ